VLEAVRNGKCKAGTALKPATINKMMAAITSVLSLAVDNDYIEHNPALRIRLSESKRHKEKRLPYDKQDLKILFNSPMYKGCEGKSKRHLKGATVIRDHKFWLPLIALYTGARQEEIGQSLIADIGSEDGIYYLDINSIDEGKSLKTHSSRRKVPLHKELIQCGFLQHVKTLKASGEKKLFPELTKDKHGKCTRPFSKWYNRYADEIGITDKRKVFHSFRHGFKDACRNAEIDEAISDALTGHSSASVGRGYA
jgi:integrase